MKYIMTVLFLSIAFNSFGQIRAAEKAVKRAEQKVADRLLEKTFNGIVDKLFGSDSTKVTQDESVKTDSTVTANSERFGGLFSAKRVEKKYEFHTTMDMVITSMDKKGKGDPIEMKMHYNKDSAYIATELEMAISITDFNQMKSYTIVGGRLTTIDLQKVMDKANSKSQKEDASVEDITYEKTGRTEMIAGHLCEEYKLTSEDIDGEYWITKDVFLNMNSYKKSFEINPNINYPENMSGTVLRMKITDLEHGGITTMETKSIRSEDISYDLGKYKVTDLSKFGF